MKQTLLLVGALMLGLALAPPARAVIVFDNLNISGTLWNDEGVGASGGSASGAQAFTTGSQALSLSELSLMLYPSVGQGLGNVTITLRSDSSSLPGGVLYTIYNGSAPSVSGFTVQTYSGLDFTLSANTTYWIAMDLADYPNGVNWAYDQNNMTPAGVVPQPLENVYSADGNHNSWDLVFEVGPLGMTVSAVAVPEPTTMIVGALLLLPFGASTLRMLRRNRKA